MKMADDVLNDLLNGEMKENVVLSALSSNTYIPYKGNDVSISEFIPHFMAFLRARLLQNTDQSNGHTPYFSPRQKEEQRKAERSKIKNKSDNNGGKTARLSLQYASSPLKTVNKNNENRNLNNQLHSGIYGISPIKGIETKRGKSGKHKRLNKTVPVVKPTKFELDSMDDFPSMQNNRTQPSKNPRRITATTVGTIKTNITPQRIETSNSTHFTSQQSTSFNGNQTSFLEESNFEAQNADPSFDNIFQGDTSRFANNLTTKTTKKLDFPNDFDMDSLSLINSRLDRTMTTPTKPSTEILNLDKVAEKKTLDMLSEIYTYICLWNMVPNVTLELYFLFTVLTVRLSSSALDKLLHPFPNIECHIYFAVTCINKMKNLFIILDRKALTLLFENSRLQFFTNADFLEYLEQEIALDDSFNLTSSYLNSMKSPNTGIAFQTDSDNRKSFISDRHFYSFSKKRDAFYSIVRHWEENIGDPEWNMTTFLTKKVHEFMKSSQDGLNNDLQFARLFVGQLLEMHKNQVGDKTEEPDTSDGVLKELKKRDPLRFQSLQNRLTGPSSTCDPCPKLIFTKVEEFFKEFIRIADSYTFNKCLIHVFVTKLKTLDSNTFGLHQHINTELNRSDFSDTLWQDIKTTISELRLCAKFLGYIIFSPYHVITDTKEMDSSREMLSESLHLISFLENSVQNHRLLVTLPWVVDLLSMADKNAFLLDSYKEPLMFLLQLYKQLSHCLRSNTSFLLNFTLTLHIGWLFDQNPSDQFDFYESTFSLQKPITSCCRNSTVNTIGLDDIVVVDKSFVHMICPYLKVIKKPLSDFKKKVRLDNSTGTFRKITPVRSTDILTISAKSKFKNQLLDGFLKYAPNHVKDCINYVTDRLFINLKHFICEHIFVQCQQNALDEMKNDFVTPLDENGEINKDNLKAANQKLYADCLEKSLLQVRDKCQQYIKRYLSDTAYTTMKCLLPQDTSSKMLEVSPKVVRHNVCNKIQEWLSMNRELFVASLESLYNRHLNHVIKANKEESLLVFDDVMLTR